MLGLLGLWRAINFRIEFCNGRSRFMMVGDVGMVYDADLGRG